MTFEDTMFFVTGLILGFGFALGFGTGERSFYYQYTCTESAIIKGKPTCVKYERKEE